jgi:hypothetical protein
MLDDNVNRIKAVCHYFYMVMGIKLSSYGIILTWLCELFQGGINTLCVISRQFSISIAATLSSRLFHWCCLIFGWCKSVLII